MEILKSLIVPGIAALVSFSLGLLVKKKPDLVKKLNATVGETGEVFVSLATAIADGKLTVSEVNGIIKEATDVYDLWRKVDKAKKPGTGGTNGGT